MSVLQAANVHFDGTGTVRIGKDGSNLFLKGGTIQIDGYLQNTTTTLAGTLSITGSVNPTGGVQFASNAITNYTVSTSAPTGDNEGDVWVVVT